MDAWNDFADASLDTGLVAELSNIFAALADDDAGVFCADEGTEGEDVLGGGRLGGGAGGRGGGGWGER